MESVNDSYSYLIDELTGNNKPNGGSAGDGADTPPPAAPSKPKAPDALEAKVSALEKKLEEAQAQGQGAVKLVDNLRRGLDIDGSQQAAEELSTQEAIEYSRDPVAYQKKLRAQLKDEVLAEVRQEIHEKIEPIRAQRIAETARNFVDKKYFVDWEAEGTEEKVLKQLRKLDPDYRRKSPGEALLTAAHLAQVIQSKEADVPYVETSDGLQRRRMVEQGKSQKEEILKRAAQRNAGILVMQ